MCLSSSVQSAAVKITVLCTALASVEPYLSWRLPPSRDDFNGREGDRARPVSVRRIRNREEPSTISQRSSTARRVAASADASSILRRRATSCSMTGLQGPAIDGGKRDLRDDSTGKDFVVLHGPPTLVWAQAFPKLCDKRHFSVLDEERSFVFRRCANTKQ
jgi:hypothetical protein